MDCTVCFLNNSIRFFLIGQLTSPVLTARTIDVVLLSIFSVKKNKILTSVVNYILVKNHVEFRVRALAGYLCCDLGQDT